MGTIIEAQSTFLATSRAIAGIIQPDPVVNNTGYEDLQKVFEEKDIDEIKLLIGNPQNTMRIAGYLSLPWNKSIRNWLAENIDDAEMDLQMPEDILNVLIGEC